MPRPAPDPRLEELASRLSILDHVEAVIVGGSISTGLADERSDYDLYVYTRQPVEVTLREALQILVSNSDYRIFTVIP